MLQPLQLEDVSARYAAEIAELRDFLTRSGLAVGTAEVLGVIAERLPRDRAFHRDLTSYIWVVIHSSDRQISYPDLLGVLAIAAAGKRFAAAANEDDAHDLLRFLMDARRSLDAKPEERHTSTPVRRVAEPVVIRPAAPRLSVVEEVARVETPRVDTPRIFDAPIRPLQPDLPMVEEEEEVIERERSPLLWVGLAAALLIALSVGLWMHFRPAANDSTASATVPPVSTGTAASPPLATRDEGPSSVRSTEVAPVEIERAPETRIAPRGAPARSTARPSGAEVYPAPSVSAHAAVAPSRAPATTYAPTPTATAPSASVAPIVRAPGPATGAPPLIPRAASAPAGAKPIPAATLSTTLGARTIPAYSAQDTDLHAGNPKYPRLLRRSTGATNGNFVAKVEPANMPTNRAGAVSAAPAGVVHPTSVGIMAGNLVYSPTPNYPAAASAARVQGEVKVQAEIDRDGNVTSTRVVSGPPLLRDAAVDAVQHWRYRPYMAHGQPVPMSATAVIEFELP